MGHFATVERLGRHLCRAGRRRPGGEPDGRPQGGRHPLSAQRRDKLSVLQSLVEVMPLPEKVDRQFLLQVLLARESLGSTALGQRHRRAARPQPDRDAHRAADGHALFPGTGDRVRGPGRPAGPHAVHDCQPHDPRPPPSCWPALGFALRQPAFVEVIAQQGSREQILAASQAVDQSIPPPASQA